MHVRIIITWDGFCVEKRKRIKVKYYKNVKIVLKYIIVRP